MIIIILCVLCSIVGYIIGEYRTIKKIHNKIYYIVSAHADRNYIKGFNEAKRTILEEIQ